MTERLPSRLLLAPDARAAERELLAGVESAQSGDPLARVVIVVPSGELRRHVLGLLVEGGRSRLAVQVLTLPALAHALLERGRGSGRTESDVTLHAVRAGELLFPLLVQRLAAAERALSTPLAPFDNGYGGAAASVRDLLDAGFGATDLDPALEALAEERAKFGEAAVERARALLRVAAGVVHELGRQGLALESGRLLAAAELIAVEGEAALPVRRALIHGFSDATGAASLLLERLFRAVPTTVLLPAPATLDPRAAAWRFGARLRERFEHAVSPETVPASELAAPVELRAARDGDGEVVAALGLAAQAIESGLLPERIALVARDLSPYRAALEREIDRRAIPASGRSGGEDPAARRSRAWRELLAKRGEATLELVLAATGPRWERRCGLPEDALRQAAMREGLLRLRDLAAEPPASHREPPPLPRLRRLAAELLAALEGLGRPQRLGRAAERLRGVVGDEDPWSERLLAPLRELERAPLGALRTTSEELALLLDTAWSDAGARPLGGEGGGIALLSVTEARALSFDRLLLLGLARDRFPRRVRTDPFLPDPLRIALRAAGLSDLPVKAEGHDEERFLFAQLLASSPSITLSWPERDEDGRAAARSTLIDELVRSGRPTREPEATVASGACAALDAAIAEALAEERLGPAFEAALAEGSTRFPASPPALSPESARAFRNRVVDEYGADPADAARRGRLGPYFGFAGAAADDDPRRPETPWITTLESLAACGWRTYLEKCLELAPPASPADELPTLPATLAGNVVHRVLESMAPPEIRGVAMTDVVAADGTAVPWPQAGDFEEKLAAAVLSTLRREKLDPALFATALTASARELLEVVQALEWASSEGRNLLAVEARAEATVPVGARSRRIRFRVDRVERSPETAGLVLTDYKTGKPRRTAKRAETRARHLAQEIAEGRSLQLAAYVLSDPEPVARLFYLRPDLEDEAREARAERGDAAVSGAPWNVLFDAWDRGTFLPRLLDSGLQKPFEGCAYCEVRVACSQGDSGARLRLAAWATAGAEAGGRDPGTARALFDLHRRRARAKNGGEE